MGDHLIPMLVCGALGAAAGCFLPAWAARLSAWKAAKKGAALPDAPRCTGTAARLLCALANGVGWALCACAGGPLAAVLAMAVWSLGAAVLLIDLRMRIIPNELLAAMLACGVPLQILTRGIRNFPAAIVTALAVMTVFIALGGFMGLYTIGAGDVKLAAVMALTLGYPMALTAMIAMAAAMLLFCLVGLALRKITLKSMVPFGPFLVPGLWVGLALLVQNGVRLPWLS